MKKLVITFCLIAIIGNMTANPVDQQKAKKIGAKFLSTTALSQKNANIQLNLVSATLDRNAVDYFVFNVSNGEGFVIVAGDDRVRPILAYSTTGKYNPNDVADGFQFTLNGFRNEIQYVRENNLGATPDIVAEWNSVTTTGNLNRSHRAQAVVGPLCQTLWNQNYPWNSQCPEDPEGDGGYVYAGCAATAMGMVMKYWDWPAVGNGSHTYNPDGYDQQTANFGQTEYHFELMPLALDSTSSEEEIFYVAQLLHHLGIALDMQYSPNGSGASAFSIYTAFQSYFRYNRDFPEINAGGIIPGYGYTNEEWAQMLKDGGLDEHLPILYCGSDDGGAGGHAFVCDGYDENDYFHFNWGWSGRDNAWCPIGALHTTRYDFNQTNHFIGHIIPQGSEYSSRPDSVSKMGLIEEAFDAVRLTWTNPTTDLNGNALTGITSITIRRNFEVIAELTDAQVGADMEYEDNGLEPGLYEYSIYVTNEAGISRTTYRSVLVGEKCNMVFILHDAGGDGWRGASISVADENFNRLAVITMTEGSSLAIDMPLLSGNLNFIWNPCWYHAYPEYDTDDECSFSILNANGETIYTSAELEEGVFFSYDPCSVDAVEETTTDNSVNVYPNPTHGMLNIQGQGIMCISVSNVLGQQLMEATVDGNTTLDLSRFESGMYLIRIETENGVTVQKVNVR